MKDDQCLMPNILDRLIAPQIYGGEIDAEAFCASIARDLDALLNTRRQEFLVPPEFEETATSIVNYGIPDFTKCASLQSSTDQGRLCKWIEEAIRVFEPRLRNISVRLLDNENVTPVVRFRVEAKANFLSERVAFDMGLKRDTGEFAVSQR